MRIVIDLPEYLYDQLHDLVSDDYALNDYELAIFNGTPLPDGAEILTKEAYSDLCMRAADVPDINNGELISRQAVDELSKALVHTTRDKADFLCNFWEGLQKLPPVTPKAEQTRWIPVSERLPEEPYGCIVTVEDEEPMTGQMFEIILPYFVGWDGDRWNDADGEQCPFEVIAWMPLSEPYKAESEG